MCVVYNARAYDSAGRRDVVVPSNVVRTIVYQILLPRRGRRTVFGSYGSNRIGKPTRAHANVGASPKQI